MPRHKRKKRAAATAAAGDAKRTEWLVGDLVVAKLRGHRPWPAQIQKPEDYGYDARPHRIFVTFFGTEETCFCSYNKITPFTSAVRKSLAEQLQKINTNPELERAIKEIFAADDELKVSVKSHGTHQKEDDIPSEKSEEEERPVERAKKRPRVVEEAVVADVIVVDDRPAKQEKTVKNMAVEQVQKLPRKVRIKVSTQSTDSANQQGGGAALPVSAKASVSSSEARNSDISPPRTSESPGFAKIAAKNDEDRPETNQMGASSVSLEDGSPDVAGTVTETTIRHVVENGNDATEKMEVDDDDTEKEAVTSKTGDNGIEAMEVDDQKAVALMTSGPAIEKVSLELGIEEGTIKGDDPTAKVDARPVSINERQCESTAASVEGPPAAEDLANREADKEQVSPVTEKDEVIPLKEPTNESVSRPELGAEGGPERKEVSVGSSKPDPSEEAEHFPATDPVLPSGLASKEEEDGAEQKDGVKKTQASISTKDEEAVSRSDVHDGALKEPVSASTTGTQDETMTPSVEEQLGVSTLQDERGSISVKEQVSVSPARDETLPASGQEQIFASVPQVETLPIAVKEQVSVSGTQDETVPTAVKEEVSVSGTQDETVPTAVKEEVSVSDMQDEAVPTAVKEQVSVSSTQDETLPTFVKELVPISTTQEETVVPMFVEELVSSTAQGETVPTSVNENVSVPITQDETVLVAVKEQVSVSEMQVEEVPMSDKEQVSVSTTQVEDVPMSEKEQVSVSTMQVEEVAISDKEQVSVSTTQVEEVAMSDKELVSVSTTQVEEVAMSDQEQVSVSTMQVAEVPMSDKEQVSVSTTQVEEVPVSGKEQVSVSPTQDDKVPMSGKEQVSVSPTQDDKVPTSGKEQVSVSPTQVEKVPTSGKEQVSVSSKEDETVPTSGKEEVSGSSMQDGKVPSAEEVSVPSTQVEKMPTSGKEQVSGSTMQGETVPSSGKEQVSLLTTEDETVPRSETQASQLEQKDGVVSQTEDHDGAIIPQIEAGDSEVSISAAQGVEGGEQLSQSREQHVVAS